MKEIPKNCPCCGKELKKTLSNNGRYFKVGCGTPDCMGLMK